MENLLGWTLRTVKEIISSFFSLFFPAAQKSAFYFAYSPYPLSQHHAMADARQSLSSGEGPSAELSPHIRYMWVKM